MRAKVADDEQTTAHAPPQSLNGSGLPYSPTKSVEILFPLAARQAHPRLAARQAPPVHAAAPHRGLRGGGRLVTPVPGTESGQGGGDATRSGYDPRAGRDHSTPARAAARRVALGHKYIRAFWTKRQQRKYTSGRKGSAVSSPRPTPPRGRREGAPSSVRRGRQRAHCAGATPPPPSPAHTPSARLEGQRRPLVHGTAPAGRQPWAGI